MHYMLPTQLSGNKKLSLRTGDVIIKRSAGISLIDIPGCSFELVLREFGDLTSQLESLIAY